MITKVYWPEKATEVCWQCLGYTISCILWAQSFGLHLLTANFAQHFPWWWGHVLVCRTEAWRRAHSTPTRHTLLTHITDGCSGHVTWAWQPALAGTSFHRLDSSLLQPRPSSTRTSSGCLSYRHCKRFKTHLFSRSSPKSPAVPAQWLLFRTL